MGTVPGINLGDNVDRVDSGTGIVRERTVEFGNTVVALHNVGSMILIDQKRTYAGVIIGGLLVLFGISLLSDLSSVAIILLIAGGLIIFFWFTRPLESYLSIGTADGKSTHLVSTDRSFLVNVREFLREKIDSDSLKTATININAGTITGGVAVGDNAQAAGASGTVNRGGMP